MQYNARGIVLLKLITDRHKALRCLSVTAELPAERQDNLLKHACS